MQILALLSVVAGPALSGPNTAMIGFHQDAEAIREGSVALGGTVRACYRTAAFCVVDFPAPPPLDQLSGLPGARYAERDQLIPDPWAGIAGDAAGTDDCDDLWELEAVGATDAWTLADGTWGPVVAVADSGFLTSHEELVGHVTGQFD